MHMRPSIEQYWDEAMGTDDDLSDLDHRLLTALQAELVAHLPSEIHANMKAARAALVTAEDTLAGAQRVVDTTPPDGPGVDEDPVTWASQQRAIAEERARTSLLIPHYQAVVATGRATYEQACEAARAALALSIGGYVQEVQAVRAQAVRNGNRMIVVSAELQQVVEHLHYMAAHYGEEPGHGVD